MAEMTLLAICIICFVLGAMWGKRTWRDDLEILRRKMDSAIQEQRRINERIRERTHD